MENLIKAISGLIPNEVTPTVAVGGALAIAAVVGAAYFIREANDSGSKRDKEGMQTAHENGFDVFESYRTYGYKPGSGFGTHERTTARRSRPA